MTFSEQTITIIDHLFSKFGIAIDWTQENIMPYLTDLFERFIKYELWTSIMWIVVMSIAFVISYSIFKKRKKICDDSKVYYDDDEMLFIISTVAFIVISVAFTIVAVVQIMDIVTCFTIPEKFLLAYIKPTT